MREVKALAKLDNASGIVRYYQAWFESPPPGWQEERDRQCIGLESVTSTPMVSTTGLHTPQISPKPSPLHTPIKTQQILNFHQPNPFKIEATMDTSKPFGGSAEKTGMDSDWTKSEEKKIGSSDGFVPNPQLQCDLSESGSFSEFGKLQPNFTADQSSSVNFVDSSMSHSCSMPRPFSHYEHRQRHDSHADSDHSFSVIFEDSGCAEKSTTDDISEQSHSDHILGECNPMHIEEGGRRSHRQRKSHQRSRSFDGTSSFSSQKVDKAFRPKSFDDSYSHNHRPPESLDILSVHDEIHRKECSAMTPSSKLYLYIQMQLCQRASLKDWMMVNSVERDRNQVLDILDQIVCAVEYIHDSGLMHRDLKVIRCLLLHALHDITFFSVSQTHH